VIGSSDLAREFWEDGRSARCPIIDMHGHMGAWGGIHFPRQTPEAMIGTMDGCGVQMLVFSHHEALLAPNIGNRTAIEAVRRFPARLRAYCVVNPNYPALAEADLSSFDQNSDVFVGIKFLPDYHGLPLTRASYRPA